MLFTYTVHTCLNSQLSPHIIPTSPMARCRTNAVPTVTLPERKVPHPTVLYSGASCSSATSTAVVELLMIISRTGQYRCPGGFCKICNGAESLSVTERHWSVSNSDGHLQSAVCEVRALVISEFQYLFQIRGRDPSTFGQAWVALIQLLNLLFHGST